MLGDDGFDPWFSICYKPRDTIRIILQKEITKYNIPIAVCFGILFNLMYGIFTKGCLENLLISSDYYIIKLIIFGTIYGLIVLSSLTVLFYIAGILLKKQLPYKKISTAVGWGLLPADYLMALFIIEFLALGCGENGVPLILKFLNTLLFIAISILFFKIISETLNISTVMALIITVPFLIISSIALVITGIILSFILLIVKIPLSAL